MELRPQRPAYKHKPLVFSKSQKTVESLNRIFPIVNFIYFFVILRFCHHIFSNKFCEEMENICDSRDFHGKSAEKNRFEFMFQTFYVYAFVFLSAP